MRAVMVIPRSLKSIVICRTALSISVMAMYSASVDDRAMIEESLLDHWMSLVPKKMRKAVRDRRVASSAYVHFA